MIRVKLTLLTQQTLLHTNPSHQDEPFQSTLGISLFFLGIAMAGLEYPDKPFFNIPS